jgi:hypothetical protein
MLARKPLGKRQLGRPRHGWAYSIKMDLKEIVCKGVEWLQLAQDTVQRRALANTEMNLQVSQEENFLTR